jgi:hypothetical protein
MSDTTLVTGLFKDRESAERAYKAVTDKGGYGPHDVSIAMSHETRDKHFAHPGMIEEGDHLDESRSTLSDVLDDEETELGTKAVEGAEIGGAVGGTIGAIVAGLAALGTALALPGIGLFMAGPIVAALVGAGAGVATGGLVGALVGWGIPEERVKHYAAGLHDGGILVAVHAKCEDDAKHFVDVLKEHDGHHVFS